MNVNRITIFIIATLLSGGGLFASAAMITMSFTEWGSSIFITAVLFTLSNLIAWACYFGMGWFWVKGNTIPKVIAIVGTISGCISLIATSWGIPFVAPAIILASFMVYTSFVSKSDECI